MGKKSVRRNGSAGTDKDAPHQKSASTAPKGEKKVRSALEWIRVGLLVAVFAILGIRLKTWLGREVEAVGPEAVRGPSDAIAALCTEELTPKIAHDLAVDPNALPGKAEVRVCLAPPRGRVLVVDDFLAGDEVAHMKGLVTDSIWRAEENQQPGYRFVHAAGSQIPKGLLDEASTGGARTERYREDEVLNEVERRIANFTGVPASMFEDLLQLSHDFHVAKSERRHANLHHDKNHGAPRHVTVLIYLTEVPLGGGGHTIFPALPTSEPHVAGADWNQTFHGIFEAAFKDIKPGDPWPAVQVEDSTPTAAALEAACSEVNRNSLAHFAVRPLPGRAVIFWQEDSAGEALPQQFHAGCPVLKGEKMSLQKFKNFAPDHPQCGRSWYCKL